MNQREKKLDAMRNATAKKYGTLYVNMGPEFYRLETVRTPSMMLNYKSGIDGFPYGHGVEVYGANKIGKSSALGYGTLANVIKQDRIPLLIATEPRLVTPEDREWALSLGLDPDQMLIQYPDNAQEAFDMLRDAVFGSDRPDYIMVDSLGGMGNESSAKEKGKPKAYGISGEVTSGLNDIMPRLYKNNQGLLLINQQRQAPSPAGRPGLRIFESPGGEALKHHMRMRIHVKPGKERFTAKIDGDDVMVGQELVCMFRKNNMSQAQEKSARFNFFHINTEQYGFGVDMVQDMINVGKLTGIIEGGVWLTHHTFPENKSGAHQLQGKNAVAEFLAANPAAYDVISDEVALVMKDKEKAAKLANEEAAAKANVKVQEVSEEEDGS
jgi:RecA/RadA recombinase